VLELHDAHLSYPVDGEEPVHAVAGVSLTVRRGELVALYGPSGSGKSTLLLLVAGLLTPDRGKVRVDGKEVGKLGEREASRFRMRDLGFIRQSSHLLASGTTLDNASLKLLGMSRREAHRRVTPLLERLELGERLHHRGAQLSMGERQRVTIVRALANEPKLLLADEPTSNLDTARSRKVLQFLREVCHERQMAALLVTHDPQAAAYADRTHELRDGCLGAYEPDLVPAPPQQPTVPKQ
jgi:putative ABC transport system ATP-binding protein